MSELKPRKQAARRSPTYPYPTLACTSQSPVNPRFHCDHFVPVFPLIPAYSRSESRNYLDFLRLRSGFEPAVDSQ